MNPGRSQEMRYSLSVSLMSIALSGLGVVSDKMAYVSVDQSYARDRTGLDVG